MRRNWERTRRLAALLALAVGLAVLPTALAEGTYSVEICEVLTTRVEIDECREGFVEGLAEAGFVEGENITYHVTERTGLWSFQDGENLFRNISGSSDLLFALPGFGVMADLAADAQVPSLVSCSFNLEAYTFQNDSSEAGWVTGVAEMPSVEALVGVIRAIQPDAARVVVFVGGMEPLIRLDGTGLEVDVQDVYAATPEELEAALGQADCVVMDPNSYSLEWVQRAVELNLPVYSVDSLVVKEDNLPITVAVCANYRELGRQTGRMAARILNGESPADIPWECAQSVDVYVDRDALARMNLALPAELDGTAIDIPTVRAQYAQQ